MEKETYIMLKAQYTKVNGLKINKKEQDKKYGQMEVFIRENTIMGRNGGEESSNGVMELNIMVNGIRIKCKVKENTNGLMAENILVNFIMIKDMGKAFTHGLTADTMKDNFKMDNNMGKEPIVILQVGYYKEYGIEENEVRFINL